MLNALNLIEQIIRRLLQPGCTDAEVLELGIWLERLGARLRRDATLEGILKNVNGPVGLIAQLATDLDGRLEGVLTNLPENLRAYYGT